MGMARPKAVSFHGRTPFAYGVQWHPEFMFANPTPAELDPTLILAAFVEEVRQRQRPPDGSAR